MPDYSKSKIYKLTSSNSNEIYIGSTILNLANRKAHHVNDYKRYLLGKVKYITSFKIIEYGGDIDICLLEEYPCNNKEQLHQRERFYIENNNCVNKNIPTRTTREYMIKYRELNNIRLKETKSSYYELNKDKIREKKKEYRELNKDYIRQKKKEYNELNKDKIKEYKKQYYELNKDKIKN
jgi:hypothetical protein